MEKKTASMLFLLIAIFISLSLGSYNFLISRKPATLPQFVESFQEGAIPMRTQNVSGGNVLPSSNKTGSTQSNIIKPSKNNNISTTTQAVRPAAAEYVKPNTIKTINAKNTASPIKPIIPAANNTVKKSNAPKSINTAAKPKAPVSAAAKSTTSKKAVPA
jgi:hypothetical protein